MVVISIIGGSQKVKGEVCLLTLNLWQARKSGNQLTAPDTGDKVARAPQNVARKLYRLLCRYLMSEPGGAWRVD